MFLPTVGIFTRNHCKYLKEAARKPETVFRSSDRWVGANEYLNIKKELCVVYFAVIEGEGMIEYQATLSDIQLDPRRGDPETERLLALTSSLTQETNEQLWEEDKRPVQTLYSITDCVRVEPFPMTDLIKLKGGLPISPTYNYGYVLVKPYDTVPS